MIKLILILCWVILWFTLFPILMRCVDGTWNGKLKELFKFKK